MSKKLGRPRTWLYEDEVAKQWKILIEKPPRCICLQRSYRYRFKDAVLFARCNVCDELYVYDALEARWVPAKFSFLV